MRINKEGLDLIKSFEGLYLTAYQDIVGVWTIGWGCTKGVKPGMTITQEQAEQMLLKEIEEFEAGIPTYISVPLNENEFAALVSFTYNLGLGSLQKSTLRKLLNAGDRAAAAEEFVKWNKAGGKPVKGLTRRREAEKALFLKPAQKKDESLLPSGPSEEDINVKLEEIEKEAKKMN